MRVNYRPERKGEMGEMGDNAHIGPRDRISRSGITHSPDPPDIESMASRWAIDPLE